MNSDEMNSALVAATNWCKEAGLSARLVMHDPLVCRGIQDDTKPLELEGFYHYGSVSDQFCRQAAMLLTLSGSPFDEPLQTYRGYAGNGSKVTIDDRSKNTLNNLPIQDFFRRVVKHDLTTIAALYGPGYILASDERTQQVLDACKEFIKDSPIYPAVANGLAELNLLLSAQTRYGVVTAGSFDKITSTTGILKLLLDDGMPIDKVFDPNVVLPSTVMGDYGVELDSIDPNWRKNPAGIKYDPGYYHGVIVNECAAFIPKSQPNKAMVSNYTACVHKLYGSVRDYLLET